MNFKYENLVDECARRCRVKKMVKKIASIRQLAVLVHGSSVAAIRCVFEWKRSPYTSLVEFGSQAMSA